MGLQQNVEEGTRLLLSTKIQKEKSMTQEKIATFQYDTNTKNPSNGQTSYIASVAYLIAIWSLIASAVSISSLQILDGVVGEFQLNIWRFGTQVIICIPFIIHNTDHIKVPKAAWPFFGGAIFEYIVFNTTFYSVPKYLPVSTTQGGLISVVIICNVILSICLQSSRKAHLYLSAIICTVGLILTTQPLFLFASSGLLRLPMPNWTSPCKPEATATGLFSPQTNTLIFWKEGSFYNKSANTNASNIWLHDHFIVSESNRWNNTSIITDAQKTLDYSMKHVLSSEAYGYILLIISGISYTFGAYMTSNVMKWISTITYVFWVGVVGTGISVIFVLMLETLHFPTQPQCIVYLLVHAIGTAQCSFTFPFCLKYISPSAMGLTEPIRLVVLLILQYTWLRNIKPGLGNWVEIMGVGLCSFGSIVGPVWQFSTDRKRQREQEIK